MIRSIMEKAVRSLLAILTVLLVSASISGCSTTLAGPSVANANKVPTAEMVRQQAREVDTAHTILVIGDNSVLSLLRSINAGNVAVVVPVVRARVVEADSHLATATKELPKAASSAETDATARAKAEAEVAAAKRADPQRKVIRTVGYGTLFAGLAAVLAGFFVPALINFAWVRTAGAGLIIFGLLTLTIEYYLTQIRWVLLGVLAAAAITALVWLWVHRKTLAEDAKWVLKPVAPPTI